MKTVLKILFMLTAVQISMHAQSAAGGAVIRDISGTVEVKFPGAADWMPAEAGMSMTNNTSISTGFKSTAILVLGESIVTVRPLTRLTLDELLRSRENNTAALSLRTGRVRAEVSPPAGGKTDFTVRMPAATASVRGTVFDIDPVNLNVREGLVRYTVAGTGAAVSVGAGRSSAVNTESPLGLESPAETIPAAFTPELPQGVTPGFIPASAQEIKTDNPSGANPSGGDDGLTIRWGND